MDQDTMVDVATYSPDRIIGRGLLKILFGLPFLASAGIVIYLVFFEFGNLSEDGTPLLLLLPAGISLLFGLHALGGIGRIMSASATNCYLRAGSGGIDAQVPRYKLFGRFSIDHYFVQWSEVSEILDYTIRVNGIPTSHQLKIRLNDQTALNIDSFLFAESIREIQQRLLQIGKAPQRAASIIGVSR